MGAYDCWCAHKAKLRETMKDCAEASHFVYAVRHALAQVEQTTMAGQTDDLLRQQIGILFGLCKTSAQLLDVGVTTKVWVAQSLKQQKRKSPLIVWAVAAGLLQAAVGIYGYLTKQWMVWALTAAAMASAGVALWVAHKKPKASTLPDEQKVTFSVDMDRLFAAIDGQMQAVDRYVNDLSYLNGQALGKQELPDAKTVALVSEMLEALYESEDEAGQAAEEAAQKMLGGLGIAAVNYSQAEQHLFTVLPSKGETRTMIPAIVAERDGRLLQRGTAAVQMEESLS